MTVPYMPLAVVDTVAPGGLSMNGMNLSGKPGIVHAMQMPGFPDKFMPFMDKPPGSTMSTTASGMYGTVIRSLRGFTARTADKEPKWRTKGSELRTGYQKTW